MSQSIGLGCPIAISLVISSSIIKAVIPVKSAVGQPPQELNSMIVPQEFDQVLMV
jgi:hypothetical protein